MNYTIFRGLEPGNESFFAEQGNITNFTDSNVIPGITYYYKISAINEAGNSSFSNEINITAVTVPTSPVHPQLSISSGIIKLNWQIPENNGYLPILYYNIYRSFITGNESFLVSCGNQTSFLDTSVNDNTTYYYKISAINWVGESAFSVEVNGTAFSLPSAPQNLQIIILNDTLVLHWQAPANNGGKVITNYSIYRSPIVSSSLYLITIGNLTSFTDKDLPYYYDYYYYVTAINGMGQSSQSNLVFVSSTEPMTTNSSYSDNLTKSNSLSLESHQNSENQLITIIVIFSLVSITVSLGIKFRIKPNIDQNH
jgi:fibronectin type 3 domain-containing protein